MRLQPVLAWCSHHTVLRSPGEPVPAKRLRFGKAKPQPAAAECGATRTPGVPTAGWATVSSLRDPGCSRSTSSLPTTELASSPSHGRRSAHVKCALRRLLFAPWSRAQFTELPVCRRRSVDDWGREQTMSTDLHLVASTAWQVRQRMQMAGESRGRTQR